MGTRTALGIALLCGGMALAQGPAVVVPAGTKVHAELKTTLDSQHAEVGQTVLAVTTSDVKEHGVKILPKGTTFTGHVTAVTPAESKKSPARMAVLFDRAETKKGQQLALRAGIFRIVPENNAAMDMGEPAMGMPGQQPMPDAASRNSDTMNDGKRNMTLGEEPVPDVITQENGQIASLARASNGAQIQVLMPTPQASPQQAQLGSVLRSDHGNLKLNSGMQIDLEIMRPR